MPTELSYHIDTNWYQQSGRSLSLLARSRLCPSCQQKLSAETNLDDLSALIKNCCSKWEGFLSYHLPLKERCFRLFLANGNQPLTLEQISERLGKLEELGNSAVPTEVLSRLIETDEFYGLRPAPASISDLEQGKTSAES